MGARDPTEVTPDYDLRTHTSGNGKRLLQARGTAGALAGLCQPVGPLGGGDRERFSAPAGLTPA